jgi:membrane-bound lytic murein transglycosylase A
VPYYTRADIDALGALKGRGLEIAWTDDRIGLFFLHIQGSGQIELPDGRRIHANFAGANGRAFHSIATKLAARGALPQGGSMQAVRAYLEAHPEEREGLLNDNPRYIFFTLADSGPFGSTELQLTAGRSIATDPAVFPPGALAYVRTKMPVTNAAGQVTTWATIHRFVLNQDTGGAIKGPARVDFYFGSGTAAGEIAGRMWAAGEMYFFLPRTRSLTTTARTARNAGRVSSSALDRPRG